MDKREIQIYLFDAFELAGHESECIDAVAPLYRPHAEDDVESRVERLASGLLMRHVFKVTRDDQVTVTNHGKPILLGGRPPYFNISNDQGLAALAVADEIVGIDVQTIGIADETVIRRFFPEEVRAEFCAAPKMEQPSVFARHWTKLEARLKALGTGLDADFRAHLDILDGWVTQTWTYEDTYMICCAARSPFRLSVHEFAYAGAGKLHLKQTA